MWRILSLLVLLASATEITEAIVGGNDADTDQFPYAAAILDTSSQQSVTCGGVILDKMTILTHASCVTDATQIKIFGNDLFLANKSLENEHTVVKTTYNTEKTLVILKVERPFALSGSTIVLPNDPQPDDTTMDIIGWGSTNSGTSIDANILQYLSLITLSRTDCMYTWDGLKSNEFCTTHYQYGVGPCKNDVGSPLVHNNTLYGILSQAAAACIGEDPNIFISITDQVDWIQSNLENNK